LTIGTRDLARAIAFYDAVLTPLGIERLPVKYAAWASWQRPGEAPKLWVGLPFNKMPAHPGNGWMAAFSAVSRKAVDEAYAAAISAGAEDEGAPGLRPSFGPNITAPMFATWMATRFTLSAVKKKRLNGKFKLIGDAFDPELAFEWRQQQTNES
jgi:catechol 2,3-dioxygenase-like lactoylglutathione lyase family enzyme